MFWYSRSAYSRQTFWNLKLFCENKRKQLLKPLIFVYQTRLHGSKF